MIIKNISGYFLMASLLLVLYLMFSVFSPFFAVLFLAAVTVTITYPLYEWLIKKLWNREGLAAFVMCLGIILVVIVPTVEFFMIFTNKSVVAYKDIEVQLKADGVLENFKFDQVMAKVQTFGDGKLDFIKINPDKIQEYILSALSKLNTILIASTTVLVKGTASFILNTILLILTVYYMFKDGKKFLFKVMYLSPLSNKYDRALFQKFREISISSILGAFIIALIQAFVASIGYMIVGLPAFFMGIGTAFAALIPVVGAAILWFPAAIYLMLIGEFKNGLFLILYGIFVIGLIDNVIRPFLIRGRTKIHPLLIFFSVFGGMVAFGFMGLFFGPLILALFLTFMHIYEMEYKGLLEKD